MKTNDIIPVNQAGLWEGRCTTDHLVKLTSHTKKRFSRRKGTLVTPFDVKKTRMTMYGMPDYFIS